MEELDVLTSNTNTERLFLNSEQLRNIIKQAKRYKTTEEKNELWNKITEILWNHINIGFPNTDIQLLCTTCFYTTLPITNEQDEYLLKIREVLETEAKGKVESKNERTLQAVSLMYGMFQSSFLVQSTFNNPQIGNILETAFKLLIRIGYEYSHYSFIAFKTMHSFKKVCGTDLQKYIFTLENQIQLLNFTNHNWENPINGVRDLNRSIFQTLLTTCDKELFHRIIEDVNSFYWNKAKYLMLTEIVEYSQEDISNLMGTNNWVDGLINSLHKPGLVSAGADMYYAVLKKIKNENEWCDIFLKEIYAIFIGSSSKAIEFFNNYWCQTTLKAFPVLLNILIEKLVNEDGEHHLHSILFLMKQGSKLSIFKKDFNVLEDHSENEKLILSRLEHYDTHVRMLAFEIICLSHEKSMPSKIEYSLIIEYIINNINSDCTVLRLNMLNSISFFLSQLHILFRNAKIQNSQQESDFINFFQKLQEFIVWSVNLEGNYQRKITSIKLLTTMISCINEIPRRKKLQTREISETLSDFLIEKKCWIICEGQFVQKLLSLLKDPSDDIRGNVLKLILNHYSTVFTSTNDSTDFYSNLVQDALQCIKNKFFYEINCGHVMFKLIINLLLKKEHNKTIFKNILDVFSFAFKELSTEYKLGRGVVASIEEGKQLHSFISILELVLEACITNSHKIDISETTVMELLDILQGVTNQFIWEQNSASSDFSKMSEMIENIIEQSGYGDSEDKDDAKISGLHQIVLNCLWLNVKASCDLAALLVVYRSDDVETIKRCLSIITHALESSRHKGVIEAAGTSLGKSIQHLTSLPEESIGATLPQSLLESKLDMLITEASKMASITRRGAGLSIMVHRIVSSDMRRGKPLFHYFMKTLLKTCENIENVPKTAEITNIENCADLPKAILIHFLTKIVTDSSLASEMMFYSAELGELAFGNLASSHWQIRNAALQLYGALIPKLIGQKKASGTDDETIATVACDELRTHSPKLWVFITKQLNCESGPDKINSHSNLIPILNLLASSAKRYSFSCNLENQTSSEVELLKNLFNILDSPIHTVRRLTAKCIFNIFSFEKIYTVHLSQQSTSENLLHGSLLLLKLCYQYYSSQGIYLEELNTILEKFSSVLKNRKHSYWSREVIDSIISTNHDIEYMKGILEETENLNEPGIFLWINNSIKKCLQHSDWTSIPAYITILVHCNDYELYCNFLLEKIEKGNHIPEDILKSIASILLTFTYKYDSCVIWNILYIISLRIKLQSVDVKEILHELVSRGTPFKLRYIIPFTASLFSKLDEERQEILVKIVFKLSDFDNSDLDTRYIAAVANNEIGKGLNSLSDDVKIDSLKAAILLLQDEDEDVRNVSTNYYKNVRKLQTAVHPYICLTKLLTLEFLESIFNEPQTKIEVLCTDVLNLLSNNIHSSNDTYNPFANDAKNIYIEVNSLKQSLLKLRNY